MVKQDLTKSFIVEVAPPTPAQGEKPASGPVYRCARIAGERGAGHPT